MTRPGLRRYLQVLPRILRLMVQYVYDQENLDLMKKSQTVRFYGKLASKREQIAQLLIYREMISEIYKTYPVKKVVALCRHRYR